MYLPFAILRFHSEGFCLSDVWRENTVSKPKHYVWFFLIKLPCKVQYRAKKSTTHKLWQIMKFLNGPDDNLHDMMTAETSEMSKKT